VSSVSDLAEPALTYETVPLQVLPRVVAGHRCDIPLLNFLPGTLVAPAPFYIGILQGLQDSDVAPFS
jgi:hypothetical protein